MIHGIMFKAYTLDIHHAQNNCVILSETECISKSSSAGGRTRRRLGNTSTCPHVRFDI